MMKIWPRYPQVMHSLKTSRPSGMRNLLKYYSVTISSPGLKSGHLDNIMHLTRVYLSLSKFRLSLLVVSTAVSGFIIAPCPIAATGILWTATGTALCAASANSLNQLFEISYDSEMKRTSNRVLVRGIISPFHACCFAITSAVLGSSVLFFALNELTALLGLFNIVLYSFVYTPMKRWSIYNTWVGSVVGAVPPLMGWVAATGSINLQACVLSAILFAWQFPHISSLSWYTRKDYLNAKYTMMSLVDPEMNAMVGLRYSLLMLPLCYCAPLLGVTTYWFVVDSLIPNALLAWFGWRFYRDRNNDSARKLFRITLFHLPLIMMLMIINKSKVSENHETQTENSNNNTFLESNILIRKKQSQNLI
ncbi:Protoheme IX farnesyltransferase, mitochondrial-like [Oopsacas minuta]|uniref:Protoheme IX farnesyltransferase, mitochondrial n=1 Tax=Oopsacas minuta TaxID=111878 RepID=A0AAV7JTQ1_9METZ|nr:Protoheme IX farnesyltransferase, mitochondrial-like [Oopsacas minuta]